VTAVIRGLINGDCYCTRMATRHCRPPCSMGIGAYSRLVTTPVNSSHSSAAFIPVIVMEVLDLNDFGTSFGIVAFDIERLDHRATRVEMKETKGAHRPVFTR
jgi:hypothetical protein